ncbi:hypothetical protein [Streptomyces sp. NPDC048644]|uniref:hypothetical protein n=1 Tax=Streptomyces sp. NPDC048644 TaxID=3365582 RepID=UPI00371A5A64
MSLAEAVDTPGQCAGGAVGVVQGALAERLVENGGRLVPDGLRVGEHRGESISGGAVEDALGVPRYYLLEVVSEPVHTGSVVDRLV